MTITERIEGVCAHPAWMALLCAYASGPANVAVTLCVLLRMLQRIEPVRLLAATAGAPWRIGQTIAPQPAPPSLRAGEVASPIAQPVRPAQRAAARLRRAARPTGRPCARQRR